MRMHMHTHAHIYTYIPQGIRYCAKPEWKHEGHVVSCLAEVDRAAGILTASLVS